MPGSARSSGISASTRSRSARTALFDTHAYAHYLHHKYFEVNYADGSIPLDKWFGTFHDGSPEADEAMKKRFMKRARQQAEKQTGRTARAS